MKFEFPKVNKISFESRENIAFIEVEEGIEDPKFNITASGEEI